jgi:hypothetical protein
MRKDVYKSEITDFKLRLTAIEKGDLHLKTEIMDAVWEALQILTDNLERKRPCY